MMHGQKNIKLFDIKFTCN